MTDALVQPAREFVDAVTPALASLAAGQDLQTLRHDVASEAYDLVAAFVDADGIHTDDELWALIVGLSPLLQTPLAAATPSELRASGLIAGKRAWLEHPSLLFDTLVKADVKGGTRHAWTYYVHALRLAHQVASLDLVSGTAELDAIERFRTTLVRELKAAAIPRTPAPAAAPTAPAAPAPATASPAATPDEAPAEEELPPPRPLDELLAELDELVGLEPVKAEVKLVANLLAVQKLRAGRGLKVTEASRHLVFTGNPGTGKTTVARLLAQIYRTLGVVEKGHLVETDRAGLVAGFVGHTAQQVKAVFEKAKGGILLIDEAYSLVRGGEKDFGREAIDMVVKLSEDLREELAVIMAGYPEEMAALIEANPGMRSRFPKTIHFPDYTTAELVAITKLQAEKAQYTLGEPTILLLTGLFDAVPRERGFGNGRLARNVFEAAVARQASRVVGLTDPTDEQLTEILPADLPETADGSALGTTPAPEPAPPEPEPEPEVVGPKPGYGPVFHGEGGTAQ